MKSMKQLATKALWFALAIYVSVLVARSNDAPRGEEALTLAVLDANPKFLAELELPLDGESLAKLVPAALEGVARQGAAADGVSLLLLRAEFDAAGTAEFLLKGEKSSGRLALPTDLTAAATAVATVPAGEGKHLALAVFVPPSEFGEERAGDGVFARPVEFTVKFWRGDARGRAPPDAMHQGVIQIVRPPVVLIHGLYHTPEIAWQTPPPKDIGSETMVQALARRGFRTYLADYSTTNGKSGGGPSRLQDNQHVVWSNPGGIRDAINSFRELGYAATQADVVGHSMGGLLTRAYIKGERLEDSGLQSSSWFLRPDNFHQGDVHRLITLCTPHQGSELVRLLLRFEESARIFDPSDDFNPEFLLRLFDLAYGVSTGAFTDQDLFSPAIAALGETRVRAHAIGCTVAEEDFADFDGVYRWNFLTMLLLTPPDLLKGLFEHPDIRRGDDAVKLLAFAAEHVSLRSGIVAKALAALTGRPLNDKSSQERHRLYNSGAALFAAAVFAGQAHDGAVSEPSAHGGLKPPCASTLPHTLHSFAPRYPATQQKVLELLEGPSSNFAESLPAPDSLWAKPRVQAKE